MRGTVGVVQTGGGVVAGTGTGGVTGIGTTETGGGLGRTPGRGITETGTMIGTVTGAIETVAAVGKQKNPQNTHLVCINQNYICILGNVMVAIEIGQGHR